MVVLPCQDHRTLLPYYRWSGVWSAAWRHNNALPRGVWEGGGLLVLLLSVGIRVEALTVVNDHIPAKFNSVSYRAISGASQ